MIQAESVLFVADNSGAKSVVCIKVLGSSKKRYGYIGDIIKVSIKRCISKSKVKKGGVYNAIIVRTTKGVSRKDGSFIRFNSNAVVILNDKLDIIGTRILGPVVKELRLLGFLKIVSLASEVL